jgi:hypothetical protein
VEFALRWPPQKQKAPEIDDYSAATLGLAVVTGDWFQLQPKTTNKFICFPEQPGSQAGIN